MSRDKTGLEGMKCIDDSLSPGSEMGMSIILQTGRRPTRDSRKDGDKGLWELELGKWAGSRRVWKDLGCYPKRSSRKSLITFCEEEKEMKEELGKWWNEMSKRMP